MSFNQFLRTVAALLVLSTARTIAGTYDRMTDNEKKMIKNGEFVFSTLSSQRHVALFEDFGIAYFRKVTLNSNSN